ncbi:unnamed protein product [Mytilus edulis]|uniref:DNA2/NAM7 helicase-like C-terminal domain-containing protein n=1 Tax=Mytilus edulis TaxID=6550 RepID=A0A8S3UQY2_MYTED|nr:unnamed protein product [Mytilus edulis]
MFYDGKLKTAHEKIGKPLKPLMMWQKSYGFPRVFCHVEGEEETLTVKTKEGNEQSKSNKKEIEQVLKVFRHMVTVEGVNPETINVMSQYNAQCTALRDELTKSFNKVNVTTVVSSQGGEWDYVIFSLVRSLPKYMIEKNSTQGWCIQNLGFITDRHQINVALTRAKKGLVIIGNKNLLVGDEVWRKLLENYDMNDCIFDAHQFP